MKGEIAYMIICSRSGGTPYLGVQRPLHIWFDLQSSQSYFTKLISIYLTLFLSHAFIHNK